MAADIPIGIGVPRSTTIQVMNNGVPAVVEVTYINDDNIIIGDKVLNYHIIRELAGCLAIPPFITTTIGKVTFNEAEELESLITNISMIRDQVKKHSSIKLNDTSDNYVSCKEDMDYDDLCTLESLLSYFKHDEALDEEIATLKEKQLMDKEELSKSNDAMMLMQYINPDYVPKDRWNHIMLAATKKPSILLNYIDEDVKISWPVRKIINGNPIMVDHGLRINDTTAADKSGKFQCHSIEVI